MRLLDEALIAVAVINVTSPCQEPSPTPLDKHEHLAVLHGLQAGDAEAAREAIRRDIVTSSSILEAKLARD